MTEGVLLRVPPAADRTHFVGVADVHCGAQETGQSRTEKARGQEPFVRGSTAGPSRSSRAAGSWRSRWHAPSDRRVGAHRSQQPKRGSKAPVSKMDGGPFRVHGQVKRAHFELVPSHRPPKSSKPLKMGHFGTKNGSKMGRNRVCQELILRPVPVPCPSAQTTSAEVPGPCYLCGITAHFRGPLFVSLVVTPTTARTVAPPRHFGGGGCCAPYPLRPRRH